MEVWLSLSKEFHGSLIAINARLEVLTKAEFLILLAPCDTAQKYLNLLIQLLSYFRCSALHLSRNHQLPGQLPGDAV